MGEGGVGAGRQAAQVARAAGRLVGDEAAGRAGLGVVTIQQSRVASPRSTAASFQPRLWTSAIPVLAPPAAYGGMTWAASPAR